MTPHSAPPRPPFGRPRPESPRPTPQPAKSSAHPLRHRLSRSCSDRPTKRLPSAKRTRSGDGNQRPETVTPSPPRHFRPRCPPTLSRSAPLGRGRDGTAHRARRSACLGPEGMEPNGTRLRDRCSSPGAERSCRPEAVSRSVRAGSPLSRRSPCVRSHSTSVEPPRADRCEPAGGVGWPLRGARGARRSDRSSSSSVRHTDRRHNRRGDPHNSTPGPPRERANWRGPARELALPATPTAAALSANAEQVRRESPASHQSSGSSKSHVSGTQSTRLVLHASSLARRGRTTQWCHRRFLNLGMPAERRPTTRQRIRATRKANRRRRLSTQTPATQRASRVGRMSNGIPAGTLGSQPEWPRVSADRRLRRFA